MSDTQTGTRPTGFPAVNPVTFDDLGVVFRKGVADFRRAPQFGLFFGGFYALGGWALYWLLIVIQAPWYILPLAISFPLIGPFAAVGLYDVSRRLERGERPRWGAVLGVVFEQRRRELVWMAFVVLFICWSWFYQFRTVTVIFLQNEGFASIDGFLEVIFTTSKGWTFLVIGTGVGGFLSLVLFSVTVISIPLLLDRERDFITAIVTSVKTVTTSPVPMLAWGLTVTVLVLLGTLAGFLGLLVALPVLGHATWHLYKHAVQPEPAG
jgi:uncharacterized membrane protein